MSFNLDAGDDIVGGLGFDWQNGWRADVMVRKFAEVGVSGPCSSVSDGTRCDVHADISSASVPSSTLMANVFYASLKAQGSNSRFHPFVVAGLGVSRNEVGPWTRRNDSEGADRPTVIPDAAWGYYNPGEAKGGITPRSEAEGSSEPRVPLTFDAQANVVSLPIWIPLQRNRACFLNPVQVKPQS
ncbi:hypothetical protein [Yoonia sp.]|uniref:hypothetical protein n=1 Tax=Yoonia sp. TaxID=2212373 RepID=UPI0025E264EE|nr:hypothetical protein [Yoonia sp.]